MISFDQFADHLAMKARFTDKPVAEAVKRGAAIIQKAAKAKIGHYQGASGPFPGWAVLKPETMADRARKGFTPNDPLLRTGKLQASIQVKASGLRAVIGSDDDVMVYQDLGTKTIPPRPALGPAAVEHEKEVCKIIGDALAQAFRRIP